VGRILSPSNLALFVKKQKRGIPSCSTAFQKEIKPITNMLLNLISYFDLRDKSADGRSGEGLNRSIHKSQGSGSKKVIKATHCDSNIEHMEEGIGSRFKLRERSR
jgi:hypothetical protein